LYPGNPGVKLVAVTFSLNQAGRTALPPLSLVVCSWSASLVCMHSGISVLSEMEMGHSLALKKILLA